MPRFSHQDCLREQAADPHEAGESRFGPPCERVGVGYSFTSALWSSVDSRRKRWLWSLEIGDAVEVVDDFGVIWVTTVRAITKKVGKHGRKMPRIWLEGVSAAYSAARVFKLGQAKRSEVGGGAR